MRPTLSLVGCLTLLVAMFAAAMAARPAAAEGERVVSAVTLRTDLERREVAHARELIHLREGDVLTADAVRQTLFDLQGSGLVTEVQLLARPAGDTVEVVVAAWSNVIVDSVAFSGELAMKVEELAAVVAVQERRPLVESRIVRSVYEIVERHEEDGFLEAWARADVRVDEGRRKAEVVFHVESGPRAHVGEIALRGDLGQAEESELLQVMESRSGEPYWPQRVRRDSDALQNFLIRRGYRTARVSRPTETYDAERGAMHLAYDIEAGPPVEVTVIGADLEMLRRQDLLAFMTLQGFDPALVQFSVRRVRTWYQSQGYYHAQVRTDERVSDEGIELTLTIEPGPRFRLTEVRLEGNESFPDATLERLMRTSVRRPFTPGSGRLVDAWLEEDLRNLRSYYALQGFGEAAVGPVVVEERGDRLQLLVPVVEGPRRRVGAVSWEGVAGLSEAELERALALRGGGPFHATLLDQALDEVRARYRDAGFERALVSSSLTWDGSGETVDVAFVVLEGPRTIVRRVVIRGQQRTSSWVLRRAIGLGPGDPVSRAQLLDIQRDLYDLGIFTSVDVSLARGELVSGERDVVVQLQEGDRHRLSLGGGYNTEDGLRGLASYSEGNLGGLAASLHLDAVVSQREELYRLLLLQPAVGARSFPLQYTLFRTREEETILSDALAGDFFVEQLGGQIEAGLAAGSLQVPLLYTYKEVDNNASSEIDEILFDREKSSVRISSLTLGIEADRRDSPLNPTRGARSFAQAEYAFPVFGTDEDFLKVFLQQAVYLDLGGAGVLGASLRLGGIESFRQEIVAGDELDGGCAADEIPDFGVAISERFFAGGRTTHRAYELDGLGIPGETLFFARTPTQTGGCSELPFTTGGNGLALLNLDYRYPFLPGFWATLFFDSGNVWADWRDISPDELRNGAGFGFGWDSPVGPLRLEIGWKLDREEFEDPYEVFLSFGTAF